MNDYAEKVETKRGERIEVSVTDFPKDLTATHKISVHCLTEHQYFHQEDFASHVWLSPWQVRGALARHAVCTFEPPRSGTWYITIYFGFPGTEGQGPKVNVRVISE